MFANIVEVKHAAIAKVAYVRQIEVRKVCKTPPPLLPITSRLQCSQKFSRRQASYLLTCNYSTALVTMLGRTPSIVYKALLGLLQAPSSSDIIKAKQQNFSETQVIN